MLVDSLSTMGNNPSSDDLIKQAKEALAARTADPEMPEGHAVDSDPAAEHQTVADRMYEKLEKDKARTAPSHPSPPPTYPSGRNVAPVRERVVPAQESAPGGGRGWRILGIAILVPIAALWALLFVGLALDPQDAGEVIGGAVILTAIPIGIGVFALRRAARR